MIADRNIRSEFINDPEKTAAEAGFIAAVGEHVDATQALPLPEKPGGDTEVERIARACRVQSFSRSAVLTSHKNHCVITGLTILELLVASLITPWSVSIERRADPSNDPCLNALLDKTFDRSLITPMKAYKWLYRKNPRVCLRA